MWMEVLMMERRDKVNYYLDLADVVSQRGTCLRKRYGAVIVKNDEIYFFYFVDNHFQQEKLCL